MTDISKRVWWSSLLLFACLIVSCGIFSSLGPKTDLTAYGVGFIAFLFAASASALLYPFRKQMRIKIFLTVSVLAVAFWSMEVFGGFAWYLADKWLRRHQ